MPFSEAERRFLAAAPVGRLATADAAGRPHVVPVCYALVDGTIVTPIDEKPKDAEPSALRRVRDVRANPHVALVVDHYEADWSRLGWVQVRGRATILDPAAQGHDAAVRTLRERYDQYRTHALDDRPCIRLDPGHVVSWGVLDPASVAGD